MTAPAWPSTKGLSVYNALSQSMRDMSDDEILAYLRAVWDPDMTATYVHEGIAFLVSKDFVRLDGETVRLRERGPNRKGKLVVRANQDRDLNMLPHWSP
jgi:hypothetical protein